MNKDEKKIQYDVDNTEGKNKITENKAGVR